VARKRSTDNDLASDAAKRAAPNTEGRLASKAKNNLVALGSAAVFTVYGAGFMRTKAAAARFENDIDDRRPPLPGARTGPVRPADAGVSAGAPASVSASAPLVAAKAAPLSEPSASNKKKSPNTHSADSTSVAAAAPSAPVVSAALPPAQQTASPVTAPVQVPVAAITPPPPPVTPAPARDSSPTPPSKNSNVAATLAVDTVPKPLKDGTFTGWGTSRHGDIQATVMIKNGKIFFAAISECMTQYSCSWITPLPPQVVARQSAEVDYVSGATQSTIAFYRAVIEAMSKAK
jgi:uncharacterized protein with FMN-binding domain